MNEYLFKIISFIIFCSNFINCEVQITGRCGGPSIPAKATKHLIAAEISRFENKEKVIIKCKNDEFPLLKQDIECQNGRWIGKTARCGHHLEAQVNHLDIFNCQSDKNELLVSQPLNQSLDSPPGYSPLKPNSFDIIRVAEGMKTSANGSNCYTFKTRFDRKVQIWFLLIVIWAQNSDSNITLDLTPFVSKYRNCILQKHNRDFSDDLLIILHNYYICDLKNASDYEKDKTEISDVITMNINTNFLGEVGLGVLFIGDIFTTSNSRQTLPDCGKIQIQNISVTVVVVINQIYISSNDSFIDISPKTSTNFAPNGNPIHKFLCNWNGQWVGDWPLCMPKISCPNQHILEEKDNSVKIEEIGNVYYLNETLWFAINESFVSYSCNQENAIMVGQNIRTCMKNGKWNNRIPYCTGTGISGLGIAGILYTVLIVFVLIVLLVLFRMYLKRVKRELRETRNELEETTRKRYPDDFYDQPDQLRNSISYETIAYESCLDQTNYESDPHSKGQPMPEYLVIDSVK